MGQFVYILINPSLKGLLKVGKTNRSPEERAVELSAGTNMPTPFVVAYEEEVKDCTLAERLIHDELTDSGFRITDSREFFSMPLKDAIRIVSRVASLLQPTNQAAQGSFDEPAEEASKTADFYFKKGMEANNGSENTLKDPGAAQSYFKRAIDLGSLPAHWWLGNSYIVNNSSHPQLALDAYKAGGEKGNASCFKEMWEIYTGHTLLNVGNEENAEVCFKWFLDASQENAPAQHLVDYLVHAYTRINGDEYLVSEKKYPLNRFPGRYFSATIETCHARSRQALNRWRTARLAGIPKDQVGRGDDPDGASVYDVQIFEGFVSSCIEGGSKLMKEAFDGFSAEDVAYLLTGAKPYVVQRYFRYIATHSRPGPADRPKEPETSRNRNEPRKKWFRW